MSNIEENKPTQDSTASCPNCGSTSIQVDKEGYGYGKGCCGAILLGPLGFLCGGLGAKKKYVICLKCGNRWNLPNS